VFFVVVLCGSSTFLHAVWKILRSSLHLRMRFWIRVSVVVEVFCELSEDFLRDVCLGLGVVFVCVVSGDCFFLCRSVFDG